MEYHQALSDDFKSLRNLTNANFDVFDLEGSAAVTSSLLSADIIDDRPKNAFAENDDVLPHSIMRFNREEFSSQINFSHLSEERKTSNRSFEFSVDQILNSESIDFDFDKSVQNVIPSETNESSLILESPHIEIISLNETEKSVKAKATQNPEYIEDKILSLTSEGSPNNNRSSFKLVSEEFEKNRVIDFNDINLDFEDINVDFKLIDEVEEKHKSDKIQLKTHISYSHGSGQIPALESARQIGSCPAKIIQCRDEIILPELNYSDLQNCALNSGFSIAEKPIDYSRSKPSPEDSVLNAGVLEFSNRMNAAKSSIKDAVDHKSHPKSAGSNFVADASLLPMSVKQLYDIIKEKYTDFAFVYALGAQLCQDRVPMDCFVYLKLGLLLSLASIESNSDRPPIPIIAIGNDAYMCNYLLTTVGQLAARFIGPMNDIKTSTNTSTQANYSWIEADPIVLAKGGVLYVGDWSRLKPIRAEKLLKDIECSTVAIEKTTHFCPLETAIWAHWRSLKNNSRDQQTFSNFIKVFGIPIIVDENNHEVLVNYILEQSSLRVFESTIDHLSISIEDMRKFMAVVSNRKVDLSEEASEILQKYFVASRVERPDCLSKQAFTMLKQFSESFAKLALRHEVIPIDAYAAIFMCENFIQNIFGTNENPPPQFDSHSYIGNVDAHMAQFKIWLHKYIKRYYDKS